MNITLLKKMIERKHWTVYRLAKNMNIEQNRIEKVINEKVKDPRISTVLKIAKALDLNEHEFAELCGYARKLNGLPRASSSARNLARVAGDVAFTLQKEDIQGVAPAYS